MFNLYKLCYGHLDNKECSKTSKESSLDNTNKEVILENKMDNIISPSDLYKSIRGNLILEDVKVKRKNNVLTITSKVVGITNSRKDSPLDSRFYNFKQMVPKTKWESELCIAEEKLRKDDIS